MTCNLHVQYFHDKCNNLKKKKTIGEQPTIQPTCMSSVEGEMLTDLNLRKYVFVYVYRMYNISRQPLSAVK